MYYIYYYIVHVLYILLYSTCTIYYNTILRLGLFVILLYCKYIQVLIYY